MRKSGVTNYRRFCQDLLPELRGKPVSFEVFADDPSGMRKQALEIASWGKSIYVKIPVINAQGDSMAPLIRELSHDGIPLNITAIFTLEQVEATLEAVRGGAPSLVSVFAGRIADTGRDPEPLIRGAAELCAKIEKSAELLWASTREAFNIVQAEQLGCAIITAPVDVIKKLDGFNRDPFDLSLDTVRTFKKDSEAAGFSL